MTTCGILLMWRRSVMPNVRGWSKMVGCCETCWPCGCIGDAHHRHQPPNLGISKLCNSETASFSLLDTITAHEKVRMFSWILSKCTLIPQYIILISFQHGHFIVTFCEPINMTRFSGFWGVSAHDGVLPRLPKRNRYRSGALSDRGWPALEAEDNWDLFRLRTNHYW